MNTYTECLTCVVAVVHSFLKRNGGMRNGYMTYARGSVRRDTVGAVVEWSTPGVEELTGRERANKGSMLYCAIRTVLEKYEIDEVAIFSGCDTSGCYNTKVEVKFSLTVPMAFDRTPDA